MVWQGSGAMHDSQLITYQLCHSIIAIGPAPLPCMMFAGHPAECTWLPRRCLSITTIDSAAAGAARLQAGDVAATADMPCAGSSRRQKG